jgi:topoisomerase IV subunit A
MGDADDLWLMATDDGYGFVVRLEELMTRLKAGKAVVNVNKDAKLLRPQRVMNFDTDRVAAATSEGKLLLFNVNELPQMARGKGVQTVKVHKAKDLLPSEKVVSVAIVAEEGTLVVHAGKRYTNLRGVDLDAYIGKRAQRGLKLPRGFQSVSLVRTWTEREREARQTDPDFVM